MIAAKELNVAITTYKYRLKVNSRQARILGQMTQDVNLVWNFVKRLQIDSFKARSAKNYLSDYDLNEYTKGSSKLLTINAQTIQAISKQFVTNRDTFKKLPRWRGRKALGWVPFNGQTFKLENDHVTYNDLKIRFWRSRDLPQDAKIKVGRFSQDARGRWYVSVTFESDLIAKKQAPNQIGIDLGIKHLAALSDGTKINRLDLRTKYLEKLRRLERTRKFARRSQAKSRSYQKLPKARQVANLAAKVANARNDFLHKVSTKIVASANFIAVGDLRCSFMNRSRALSGVSLDAGIGKFREMLRYKSIRDGGVYKQVSERNSTQTCSDCGRCRLRSERIGLGVRSWVCDSCGASHDRDVNAARNILLTALKPDSTSALDTKRRTGSGSKRSRKIGNPSPLQVTGGCQGASDG